MFIFALLSYRKRFPAKYAAYSIVIVIIIQGVQRNRNKSVLVRQQQNYYAVAFWYPYITITSFPHISASS